MEIHISFVPEILFKIGDYAITNSLFTAILAIGLATLGLFIYSFRLSTYKPSNFQIIIELMFEGLNGLAENILGVAGAKKFLGFLLTFFIFILASNWFALMPFVPAVGQVKEHSAISSQQSGEENQHEKTADSSELTAKKDKNDKGVLCLLKGECYLTTKGVQKDVEFTTIFRAPTADLSSALTLSLISVIVTNLVGLTSGRMLYIKKYINFSDPINFFVGALELVSEFGKIISFAFRLFGNIFAGEVLLTVITSITFGVVTLPFLGLEVFVGIIQALIFFMLTAVFIGLAKEHH